MKYHTLFFRKLGKMSQNLSSAAVVIGALRVNEFSCFACFVLLPLLKVYQAMIANKTNGKLALVEDENVFEM